MLLTKAQSILQMWEIIGKKGIEAPRHQNAQHVYQGYSPLSANPQCLRECFLVFHAIGMFILLFQLLMCADCFII